ncbi:MAG: hypothetical protein WC091_09345 [Sulfuricellaceae bacterium]
MKKTRFASYLLTGKAATLPFMINSSMADVTPYYTELTSQHLNIIEQPTTGVKLLSTTASAPSDSYGGQSYGGGEAAQLCNAPLPGVMNVVITGVKPNDTVYLVASSDKDSQANLAVSPQARIGTANMTLVSGFKFNAQETANEASSLAQTVSSVSVQVDMNKLQAKNLFAGGEFYLQAIIFPTVEPGTIWQQARFSELDKITVSSAGCTNMYGSTPSLYGSSVY